MWLCRSLVEHYKSFSHHCGKNVKNMQCVREIEGQKMSCVKELYIIISFLMAPVI